MDPAEDDIMTTLEWPGHEPQPGELQEGAAFAPPAAPDGADQAEPSPAGGETGEAAAAAGDRGARRVDSRMPLLPALVSRVDEVTAAVTTLTMRLDALTAVTESLRSVQSDRLRDYADAIALAGRSQVEAIEEYRQGHDHTLAELRRSLGTTEESLRKLSGRLEKLTAATVLAAAPAASPAPVLADDDLRSEIELLRVEVQNLKRRIAVRAKARVDLDEEQLDSIARKVQRLVERSLRSDEHVGMLADGIVGRLEAIFEVVPPDEAPPPAPAPAPAAAPVPAPAPAPAPARKRGGSRAAQGRARPTDRR